MSNGDNPGDDVVPVDGAADGAAADAPESAVEAVDPSAPVGRAAARERARELRELHKKQDRRRRLIVQGSIVGGSLAILVAVALVLFVFARPGQPGPQNMLSDGIKIGERLEAVNTGALKPDASPVASEPNADGVVDIRIYLDYLCPTCGDFQAANGEYLENVVDTGVATVEIHPLALLTAKSAGTQYSLRAANAAACVAQYAPDQFYAFHAAMLTDVPEEGSEGLSDDQILQRAADAGVKSTGAVKTCVADRKFKNWVTAATMRALNGPLPSSDTPVMAGTLMVLVNGKLFTDAPDDPNAFAQFVLQAAGETFADSSTPTPTPAPSGTTTPTPAP